MRLSQPLGPRLGPRGPAWAGLVLAGFPAAAVQSEGMASLPAAAVQPEGMAGLPVSVPIEFAPGFEPWQHVIEPPSGGVMLGCYGDDVSRPWSMHPCWWDLPTGELHELSTEPLEIGGFRFVPVRPLPGVDSATGAVRCVAACVEWVAWMDAGEPGEFDGPRWAVVILLVPEFVRSADFDGDLVVDTRDYLAFLSAWSSQRDEP